jgi:hypothetical protein
MLEAMATLILVIVGLVLFLFVMVYGIYVTFYPLSKTVKGGIEAMQAQAEEVSVAKEAKARAKARREPTAAKEVVPQEE